jgi:hypothetical protein
MSSDQAANVDRLIAFLMSFRLPILATLVAMTVVALVVTFRVDSQYIQNWAIEIFGAALIFLAVVWIDPARVAGSISILLLFLGIALGVGSYLVKGTSPLDAVLIEASAAFVLFVFLEVVVRRTLELSLARERSLQQRIQAVREETIEKVSAHIKSLFPTLDMEAYEEGLEHLVFGDNAPPVASEMVRDDPAWEALWKQSAVNNKSAD